MSLFLWRLMTRKNNDDGFTLIELLVVIIIIGILAAIALPSFLNQANKARQSEAQTYIGSINRAQQAYYLEERAFAPDLDTLAIGIPATTDNYDYVIDELAIDGVDAVADPPGVDLIGYRGTTWIGIDGGGNATTLARLCEGTPGVVPACDRALPVAP